MISLWYAFRVTMRVHYDARNGSFLEGDSGVCVDPVRGLDKQLPFF